MGKSVEATAELADGWLPIMFIPEQLPAGVGRPAARPGWPSARPSSAACEISAGGMVAIGEDLVGDAPDQDPRHGPAR